MSTYSVATVSHKIEIGRKINMLTVVSVLGSRWYGGRYRRFVGVVCDCGVQNRNNSRNRYVMMGDEKLTFSEAARKLGIHKSSFSSKIRSGKLNLEIIK